MIATVNVIDEIASNHEIKTMTSNSNNDIKF